MAVTDQEILDRLDRIERQLSRLVAPVAAEEARQLAAANDAQRKEHNKNVLRRARERQKGRAA